MNQRTRVVVATIKSWNLENFKQLVKNNPKIEFFLIASKEELTPDNLKKIGPRYIFFPHWSWIIPKEIYENYESIVFHMTDLPYGRGGSPLQNLIVRGKNETMISSIKVVEQIDAGSVYIKKPLGLDGTAQEIFTRASKIVFDEMIPYIIKNNPKPKAQEGEITQFSRRNAKESDISKLTGLKSIYDHIRMLDGEGYPSAFIETEKYIARFYGARYESDKIIATCEIKMKNKEDDKNAK
jgi:methionyl-tRNA formyltransferase